MTHDELLARIDGYIEHDCDCWQCNMAKALRAVVKLQGKDESLLHTGVKNYADGYNQALADVRITRKRTLGHLL